MDIKGNKIQKLNKLNEGLNKEINNLKNKNEELNSKINNLKQENEKFKYKVYNLFDNLKTITRILKLALIIYKLMQRKLLLMILIMIMKLFK